MNVLKNIILSFVIIFALVLIGLVLHFHRSSAVMISHEDIEEEWEELSHAILFQDALNNLIYDITEADNFDKLEKIDFKNKISSIQKSLEAIKICSLHLPDDQEEGESHVEKENQGLSALRMLLSEFTVSLEKDLKEDKLTAQDAGRYVAKLLEIKKISVALQKVHTEGMIASLKNANSVQKRVLREEVFISLLILLVVALASYLAVQYLHHQTVGLMNKQRVQTIGMLARSFVHEIRNPLSIIKSSSGLIRDRTTRDKELSELAGFMIDEVTRIDDLLFQFLSLGDNKKVQMDMEDLNIIVDQCLVLIEGECKKNDIQLEQVRVSSQLQIICNKNQIKQVVVNLLLNALQASRKGGKLIVRTALENARPILSIKDFGKGIEANQLGQLFDPFFTTKDSGFGIGLFIVKKIIDEHEGTVEVQSQVGHGTEFKICFKQY